jgi:hypothetical protein
MRPSAARWSPVHQRGEWAREQCSLVAASRPLAEQHTRVGSPEPRLGTRSVGRLGAVSTCRFGSMTRRGLSSSLADGLGRTFTAASRNRKRCDSYC